VLKKNNFCFVFEYTQTSLRNAKDIFKKAGHVTPVLKIKKSDYTMIKDDI
jgi:hypothetical protein